MAVVHNGAAAVRLTDGRVLVCGGRDGSAVPTNICEIYDRIGGTWTQTGSMNVARGFQNAVGLVLLANGKVLAVGESFLAERLQTPPNYMTPPQELGSLPAVCRQYGRSQCHPVAERQSLGRRGNDCCGTFSNAELYDPSSGLWTPTGSLNQARAQHIAVLLGAEGVGLRRANRHGEHMLHTNRHS